MAQPTSPASAYGAAGLVDAFKEQFPQITLNQLSDMERDFLKWVPKKDNLVGDGIWVPMRFAKPQGLSSNFAGMQASHTEGQTEKAFITRNRYYSGISVDAEAMYASRDTMGAFFEVKVKELEDVIKQHGEELEKALWGDGSGIKGTIASITNANPSVITLTVPEEVANFSYGEYLECRDGATDRGGDERIASVNYDAGTLTMTSNVVADHAWAAGDTLIRGTADASASDYNALLKGVSAWIPETAETSGTFLQMDRTKDVERLQGFRQGYAGSIEETVKNLCTKGARLGAKFSSGWLTHGNWNRLEIELGSRAIRDEGSDVAFGIPNLKYNSSRGPIRFMPGTFMKEDTGYLLNRDTWTLHHMRGLPHIVDDDGLNAIRGEGFDGIEIRIRHWAGLSCEGPKHNARFAIG